MQAQAGTAGLGGGIAYVFLQSAYASAGITSLRGQGFVLARAGGKWAAPAYISVYKLGAGLSIGATRAVTHLTCVHSMLRGAFTSRLVMLCTGKVANTCALV